MGKHVFTDESRALLEGLLQPLAIYQFIDKRVVTLVLSDGFCELFGYDDRALAYRDMDNDMYKDAHPDDVARIADAALRFATEGGVYDVVYRTKDGSGSGYRIVHATGKHAYTDEGARLAYVWYTDEGLCAEGGGESELSEALGRALREESLMHANRYDYLTGLPSMSYFFELAEAGRLSMLDEGERPALLFANLSGMRFFNTHNGFAEGDKLLKAFAGVLKKVFSNENCCHVGGDHFAVFTKESGLEEVLDRLLADCRAINDGNNLPVHIGVYLGSVEDVHVTAAYDRAKFACDLLRNAYGSCFGYYDRRQLDDIDRRHHVLANLDRAIAERWIQVYYQPIIRAVNGQVCDEEALSRWVDPVLGTISPGDFIPALEDAGVVYKLDLYVLDRVLEKMKAQRERGLAVVPHSINLSRSDFVACDIVDEVRARVDAAGVERSLITIEVTESTVGSDREFMAQQVGRFRSFGFPVWMDDFGSEYSSIAVLQDTEFDLIKFDMSFMRQFDEGERGKIVLTELMRMATALGADTVCEGVETAEQALFLREIGCSKLQGYHFCRPIPFEEVLARYEHGFQIGFENPDESAYYDVIGGMNLYDLASVANGDADAFQNYFDMLPMGIVEIGGDNVDFIRTNKAYRDFMRRFFGFDLEQRTAGYSANPADADSKFMQMLRQCCAQGGREFIDESMPDGSIVHSFARRIGVNPVTGKTAAIVAVLSIVEPDGGATYASIARALAADYYNIYYVDLDTERFIEYSSPVGGEQLAVERHGEHFFEASKRDAMLRIYDEDREAFIASFTKENVVATLDEQGVYTITYRLVSSGEPTYANMKVTRMRSGGNQIIVGISIIDAQMKQEEYLNRILRERDVLARTLALSEGYLSLYAIDPETKRYVEYNSTSEYESLGLPKEGEDFFRHGAVNGEHAICGDDLPMFRESFTEENVMREIREHGVFSLHYRLAIGDEPKPVTLRIARAEESGGTRLIAGVRERG